MQASGQPLTVTGVLGDLNPGDVCAFQGEYREHPKYGRQFEATVAIVEIPRDEQGLREYLDRSFKWVGPVMAGKLVKAFGTELFDVIENTPAKLAELPGITPDRAVEIHTEYLKIKIDQTHDVWFATHGLTLNLRNKLIDEFGSKAEAIEAIKANPYKLADVVHGIGFKKADVIAGSMGIKKDSRRRLKAGLRWILKDAGDSEGHCYLPVDELVGRGMRLLEASKDRVIEMLQTAVSEGTLTDAGDGIYFPDLWEAEQVVADQLKMLAKAPHEWSVSRLDPDVVDEMDADQRRALDLALSNNICIITGGPGTGKSWTVDKIIRALGDVKIELAAPTGKAAKRMTELTGRPARTIHRLLEYHPDFGFGRNENHPLECDVLILDEVSMIDINLMASLMRALTDRQHLIMVGDVDQLPSVGPGAVLSDMIQSGIIPTSHLRTLHRQAAASWINRNAQRINRGEKLMVGEGYNATDFWFLHEEDATKIPALIVQAIRSIPKNWPELTPDSIQVLCPQKRGPVGTIELNRALQPILNPSGGKLAGVPYHAGDRVIQTRNNYRLEIFNGDIGHVLDADRDFLYVEFDDIQGVRVVEYPLVDIDDLQMALALTIHKSQGSEFPVVVVPVHTTNYIMLKKNLLYTGITRGKKLVILIGTMKAANIAIHTLDSSVRFTGLRKLLQEAKDINHASNDISY